MKSNEGFKVTGKAEVDKTVVGLNEEKVRGHHNGKKFVVVAIE